MAKNIAVVNYSSYNFNKFTVIKFRYELFQDLTVVSNFNESMYKLEEIENKILKGDIVQELREIPDKSIDLIFADPPYFMQTEGDLIRAEGTKFSGVEDDWDKFNNYEEYDKFCENWLKECKRVLKKDGTIWVIGAFQNIYRIGYIMQNLDFWIINDIIWSKSNPVPNFKGTRFTNASETMLWCCKSKSSKYTFNYKTMKHLNGGKQMRSVWNIALCTGKERIKDEVGKKAHSTQKPEQLLENVILSSSSTNDLILDPFMGSGTTAAVAKRLNRRFIGIEREQKYIDVALKRIEKVNVVTDDPVYNNLLDKTPPRVSVEKLLNENYLHFNETFYSKNKEHQAVVNTKGHLEYDGNVMSIHKLSAQFLNKTNNNGWDYWYVLRDNKLVSIDEIRKEYRRKELNFVAVEL